MSTDRFTVPEIEALATAADHDGPIIVDLDETLYLRNSTAEFLDCAVPGVLAVVLLIALDLVGPWRWTGGRASRDSWRVLAVTALLPWTMSRWRSRCRTQGAALTNVPLLQAVRAKPRRVIVATNGFLPIVRPLLLAMGCGDLQLIGCRLSRFADRNGGKLALIEAQIEPATLAEALVITDSADDAAVLERCRRPCLTIWHGARYQRPFARAYAPGFYTAFVKRPGPGGFNPTLTSFMFWFVIPLTSGSFQLRALAATVPLFWSLWAVYEIGYYDNDVCGKRYESDPRLSAEFEFFQQSHFEIKAWIWALALGAGGWLVLGHEAGWPIPLAWLALLVATRLLFYFYNRQDKETRIWWYLPLQLTREAGFIVFATINWVGAVAVAACILAKWIEYAVYRYARSIGSTAFPYLPHKCYRLVIFVLLSALLAASERSMDKGEAISFAMLLVINLALARGELMAIATRARRIDRKPEISRPQPALNLIDETPG